MDEKQRRQALAADSRLVQGMDSSQFHGCWQQCRAVCANAAVARRGRVRLQYRRLCPQSARRTRMRRNVWVVEPCSLEMRRHRWSPAPHPNPRSGGLRMGAGGPWNPPPWIVPTADPPFWFLPFCATVGSRRTTGRSGPWS